MTILQLVDLLRDGTLGARRQAETALARHLRADDSENTAAAIAAAGGASPLVTLLEVTGGVESLVELLAHGTPVDAQKRAARALGRRADGNRETQKAIAAAGGIARLVVLLGNGGCQEAAYALRTLAWRNGANQRAIAEAGGVAPLVALLQDGACMKEAAHALRHLAWYNEANRQAIAIAGGIAPLIALLTQSGAPTPAERAPTRTRLSHCDDDRVVELDYTRHRAGSPEIKVARHGDGAK
jgi:hypothetical protein